MEEVLEGLIRQYPVRLNETTRVWKITEEERSTILNSRPGDGTSGFLTLCQSLNFEDMARRSNNILEAQFFNSLARDKYYGFAAPRLRGDALIYRLSDNSLGAFVHCYAVGRQSPTFSGFVDYLEDMGFTFDGEGRELLQRDLVQHGFLNDLADAGEAKSLTIMYQMEATPA